MDAWKWAVAGVATAITLTVPAGATAAPARSTPDRLIELRDLGGGNSSYFRGMNDRGDVVGVSLSKGAGGYAPALWLRGSARPIALNVKGGSPGAINNNGVVAGTVSGTTKLFVWSHGRTRYVAYPGRNDGMWVSGINDRGQAIGSTYVSPLRGRAFVLDRGVVTDLPTPPGNRSTATAINNRGQILGSLLDLTTSRSRAVIWSPLGPAKRPHWKWTDLGSLAGGDTLPADINDRGQVIGSSEVPGSALPHPFLWQNGKMIDLLGGYPAVHAVARAINDAGLVAGHMQVSLDGDFHAVVWRKGKLVDINRPGYNSEAAAVNNRGQVAGLTQPVRTDQAVRRQPFRWQSGWTKLYAPPPSAADVSILGLDAAGRIAVSVITNDQALILRSAR